MINIWGTTTLVLRTVRASGEEEAFVPHFSVTGGVILAISSLTLLIYFIHHTAASIQPTSIISSIAEGTSELIETLFPERVGDEASVDEARQETAPDSLGDGISVPVNKGGYLQAVDVEALLALAREEGLLVKIESVVGNYAPERTTLATVWPRGRVHPELVKKVNRCFAFGRDRTMQQDPEYGVLQVSDIGVKALSPGINDPTTATTCLDYLSGILRNLARREELPLFAKVPTAACA